MRRPVGSTLFPLEKCSTWFSLTRSFSHEASCPPLGDGRERRGVCRKRHERRSGHVDRYHHWAVHLLRILELQRHSGGITEFVPLSFVADEAPIYRRGQSRRGPTLRESVLMHAVSRLVLSPDIPNIQTSWVKMGLEGASLCLRAGANDIGGTLMNESITRAAGARHGQEMTAETLEKAIQSLNRRPYQRNTFYDPIESNELQLIGNAYTDFYGNPVRDQSFPRSRRRPAGTGWVSRA